MVWSGVWDRFFLQNHILFIQKHTSALERCRFNRNVEDESITIPDKRRDYNLWAYNLLVLTGEDKCADNLGGAKSDLQSKNSCDGNCLFLL
jgi:hypothetical protein